MSVVAVKQPTRMSNEGAIRAFLRYADSRLAERTKQQYRGILWRFSPYMPAYIDGLCAENIERYLESLKITNSAKNLHLSCIKSFCGFLGDFYDLPNPAKKIKRFRQDPPKRRWLTAEEVEKILSVCTQDEKKIILLLLHTGLRADELRRLQPNNISPDLQSITFIGKRQRERTVPLNQTARDCVSQNLNFLESYRRRNQLYYLCKKLSKKAGVPIAGPHSFRRYFANSLLKRGVSLVNLMKLLGHSKIETTMMYLDVSHDLLGLTNVLDF